MEIGGSRLVGDGLELRYDDRVVVEHLDIAVPDDRFSVIVGPNACGKSTLLRALARIIRPGEGQIVLDGKQIDRVPAREIPPTPPYVR